MQCKHANLGGFCSLFFCVCVCVCVCVPPVSSVPRLAISGSEGSAAGGRDTMWPIVLLTPSPEGTRMGPRRPGSWTRTWCERAQRPCAVIWFVPLWLVKVRWDVAESADPYRKCTPEVRRRAVFQLLVQTAEFNPKGAKERDCAKTTDKKSLARVKAYKNNLTTVLAFHMTGTALCPRRSISRFCCNKSTSLYPQWVCLGSAPWLF